MLVVGYTGRVRKARDVPRTRYMVDIVLWERCALRVWFKENINNLWVPFLDTICF